MPAVPRKAIFRQNHHKIVYRHSDPASGRTLFYSGARKQKDGGTVVEHEDADESWQTEEAALAWLDPDA